MSLLGLSGAALESIREAADGGPVLVAFSGGGDSTAALLIMIRNFLVGDVHACVVDHATREGSAQDAAHAAAAARAMGASVRVHRLAWPTGAHLSQARLRQARYEALCAEAHAIGAKVIVTGHTFDDRIETVLMRLDRGAATLRGMAILGVRSTVPAWPGGLGLVLMRPLVYVRRADLRTWLRETGQSWIEDPANDNPAFERVRARTRLAAMERGGFDPMMLHSLTWTCAIAHWREQRETLGWIAGNVRIEDARIEVARSALSPRRIRALSVLLAAAGGGGEPRPEPLQRLFKRLAHEEFRGATLAGARVQLQPGGVLAISRDLGAVHGRSGVAPLTPLHLRAGETACWDGRARIRADADLVVTPDGKGNPVLTPMAARSGPAGAVTWLIIGRISHLLGDLFTPP